MNISQLLELNKDDLYNWLQTNQEKVALIAVSTEFGKAIKENVVTPSITPTMKPACMGEHEFSTKQSCHHCDEDDEDECEYCNDSGTIVDKHVIPWTSMKDIYEDMANIAIIDNKK